jgi:hypothetical protein
MFEKQKNTKKLVNTFTKIVEPTVGNYQPDCLPILKPMLYQATKGLSQDIKNWGTDFDYEDMARLLIVNFTFDEVSSGKHHIYRGVLSPVGHQLLRLYTNSMNWYQDKGKVSKEDLEDQFDIIIENISIVG